MDFTTTIAAPALCSMQERSDIHQTVDSRERYHSVHPMQEQLLEQVFSIKSKSQYVMEVNHPYPLQQKLMRRLFAKAETKPMLPQERLISDPKPLRQQAEPKVKISLKRRITDSADLTWQIEMAEDSPFVFEEVL